MRANNKVWKRSHDKSNEGSKLSDHVGQRGATYTETNTHLKEIFSLKTSSDQLLRTDFSFFSHTHTHFPENTPHQVFLLPLKQEIEPSSCKT